MDIATYKKLTHQDNPYERDVKSQVLQMLQFCAGHKGKFWRQPNTGIPIKDKKTGHYILIPSAGEYVVDILGCYRGRFVAIETKRPKTGKASRGQLTFIEQIRITEGFAVIITDSDQVQPLLKMIDEKIEAEKR